MSRSQSWRSLSGCTRNEYDGTTHACGRARPFVWLAALLWVALGVTLAPGTGFAQTAAETPMPELPPATDVTATWTLDREQMTVGDVLDATLTVEHPAGTQALLPTLDERWGDFEVRSQSPVAVTEQADGTLTTQQTIKMTLFAPGAYELPPFAITVSDAGGTLRQALAAPASVTVTSVLAVGDSELRDIKDQAALPAAGGLLPQMLPLLGGLATLLMVVGGGWWLFRRRQPPRDLRTPLQRALDELERIAGAGYPAAGEAMRHYEESTDVLRRYLEDDWRVPALELTTAELQTTLERTDISPAHRSALIALLADADLVKFAKVTPSPAAADELLSRIRMLVQGMAVEAEARATAAAQQANRSQPALNGA